MKNFFRKLKGKEKDSAGQRASRPASTQIPTQKGSNGPPGRGTSRCHITSSVPVKEIGRTLLQPANSIKDPGNVIQIELDAICPICRNFDPYHIPSNEDLTGKSWAKLEYSIPKDTAVGKISLKNSEELIDASKDGCVYCTMVVSALDAAHPGWQSEKSFIDIFLAVGVPVNVRLQFGTISSVPIGRDELLALGIELPEGQRMNFDITISDPSKPPIEVEIYRPTRHTIPESQLLVGDVVVTPLLKNIGFANEISEHSSDQECFDFIKDKVWSCVKQHKCGTDGPLPLLPDRVVWTEASNTSGLQLLEPQNIRASFIAVSYCWGSVGPDTYLTDARTLSSKKSSIEFDDLPPLFQDVVTVARTLGIEYIWIDRLCIIQGDDEDFRVQAPKMEQIYGSATLTIAAAAATTENDRILIPREDKWLSFDMTIDVGGFGRLALRVRQRSHTLGTEDEGGDYGKISTRAWIWQERLLAARTVFFTPSALKFECRNHSHWEGADKNCTGHSWSAKLDQMTHFTWLRLVEEYMGRDITRPSDRLPAMNSVMKRVVKGTEWTPCWGLWANAFVESLGWKVKSDTVIGKPESRMNPSYYAPTWSWASVDGPISYLAATPMNWEAVENNDPMQWDLECRSLNSSSGLVRIAAYTVALNLHFTVERDDALEDDSEADLSEEDTPRNTPAEPAEPTEPPGFRYKYRVKGAQAEEKGFPIYPDVTLKPWTGDINGEKVSTIIRAPYGETPPEQSWTGPCTCVLVGKRKMRAVVLILGRSLRVPGAWERVGMTDGINPAIFPVSQRHLIDLA